jgi:ankyrin repeat protein
LLLLAWTDETTWDRFSVSKLARSPEAGDRFLQAVVAGNVATVRAFLAHGIAINNCYLGWTALHVAASEGRTQMARYLLDQGANLNAVDTGSSTPVDVAEGQHHDDTVALLRARGGKAYNELAPADRQAPCPVKP